jgi:mRNA-degrading endonuclease RelE of RelBE toxin-antitoxin system
MYPSKKSLRDLGFKIRLSKQVEKYLENLRSVSPREAERCAGALRELAKDPFAPRPGVDIKKLHGVRGLNYRLRAGRHRFYCATVKEKQTVHVKVAYFK